MKPTIAELLDGVAEALHDTVLPELEAGPARDQVQAAIGIVRKAARALPQLAAVLEEDNRDIAAALAAAGRAAPAGVAGGAGAGAEAGPGLALDELDRRNDLLHDAVAAWCEAGPPPAELRALLERMTARRASLRLSPWER